MVPFINGSTYSYQSSYGVGDTVGVAIDSKNKKVWLSKMVLMFLVKNPETGKLVGFKTYYWCRRYARWRNLSSGNG